MVEPPPRLKKRIKLGAFKPKATFEITYNEAVETVDTIDPAKQLQMLHLCDALFDPAASTASMQSSAQAFHDIVQRYTASEDVQALYSTIKQIIIKKHFNDNSDQRISFDIDNDTVKAGTFDRSKKSLTDQAVFAKVGEEHVDFQAPLQSNNYPVAFSFNLWRDANDAPLGTYYRDIRTFTSPPGFELRRVLMEREHESIEGETRPNYKFDGDAKDAQQSHKGQIIPVATMPHRAPTAKSLQTAMNDSEVTARYNVIVLVEYEKAFTVTEQGDKSNSQTNLRF